MRFIVLPISDVTSIFSPSEVEGMRKSIDGTEVIMHEEILAKKKEERGEELFTDPETGEILWDPYQVYQYGTRELDSLLESPEWTSPEPEF